MSFDCSFLISVVWTRRARGRHQAPRGRFDRIPANKPKLIVLSHTIESSNQVIEFRMGDLGSQLREVQNKPDRLTAVERPGSLATQASCGVVFSVICIAPLSYTGGIDWVPSLWRALSRDPDIQFTWELNLNVAVLYILLEICKNNSRRKSSLSNSHPREASPLH
jgi:hypothetical protein